MSTAQTTRNWAAETSPVSHSRVAAAAPAASTPSGTASQARARTTPGRRTTRAVAARDSRAKKVSSSAITFRNPNRPAARLDPLGSPRGGDAMMTAPEGRRHGLFAGERVVSRRCQHWLVPVGEMLVTAPLMLVVLFTALLVALWVVSLTIGLSVAGSWVAIPMARWSCWTLTLTDRRVILTRGLAVSVRTAI